MTALSYAAVAIVMPDDMTWSDEFTWRAVTQTQGYGVTGALLVESALKLTGRPITLAGEDRAGWVGRAALNQLRVAANLAGQVMTLNLRGVNRTVMFDHAAGAIDARPVVDYSDPVDADFYVLTLRFIEVPAP